jgi:hypothetical protein
VSDPASSPLTLRWRERSNRWRDVRSDVPIDPSRYRVEPVSAAEAKAFVVRHHYSGSYPADRLRYGLLDRETGSLAGVAVLSVPPSVRVLTNAFPGLEPYVESLELGRFVLLDEVPANGESWFLARALRAAAERGLRGIVSFSDPVPRYVLEPTGQRREVKPGHVGIISQALGMTYTGRGAPSSLVLVTDPASGRQESISNRALQKVRGLESGHRYVEERLVAAGARPRRAGEDPAAWLAAALTIPAVTRQRHRGNHRYLLALGDRTQRRRVVMAAAAAPYPKLPDRQAA